MYRAICQTKKHEHNREFDGSVAEEKQLDNSTNFFVEKYQKILAYTLFFAYILRTA